MPIDQLPIPRRNILAGAGALGVTLLAPKLPLWSLAEAAPAVRAPASFTALSSALVGVPEKSLEPLVQQDNYSTADVFYGLENLAGAAAVQTMLAEWESYPPGMPAQVRADRLLKSGTVLRSDAVGTFSRLTMLAWLYGVWYGGTEVQRNSAASRYIVDPAYRQDFIISGRAYKNSWIWRIAQSHPMGFSQFNFGSWASPPPTLTDDGITPVS